MKYWLFIFILTPAILFAESRHIHVYSVSQAYYDVKPGDTLGEISQQILPNTPSMRKRLMTEIVQTNPEAFINRDPNQLRAHVRLWLPNHTPGPGNKVDKDKFTIKEYSWGYTKTPR
ncbi:MAG: FimV family protein [Gammaproteobacteria bacterium]